MSSTNRTPWFRTPMFLLELPAPEKAVWEYLLWAWHSGFVPTYRALQVKFRVGASTLMRVTAKVLTWALGAGAAVPEEAQERHRRMQARRAKKGGAASGASTSEEDEATPSETPISDEGKRAGQGAGKAPGNAGADRREQTGNSAEGGSSSLNSKKDGGAENSAGKKTGTRVEQPAEQKKGGSSSLGSEKSEIRGAEHDQGGSSSPLADYVHAATNESGTSRVRVSSSERERNTQEREEERRSPLPPVTPKCPLHLIGIPAGAATCLRNCGAATVDAVCALTYQQVRYEYRLGEARTEQVIAALRQIGRALRVEAPTPQQAQRPRAPRPAPRHVPPPQAPVSDLDLSAFMRKPAPVAPAVPVAPAPVTPVASPASVVSPAAKSLYASWFDSETGSQANDAPPSGVPVLANPEIVDVDFDGEPPVMPSDEAMMEIAAKRTGYVQRYERSGRPAVIPWQTRKILDDEWEQVKREYLQKIERYNQKKGGVS